MAAPTTTREVATFGGGCFWCLEAVFESLRGVERVVSGYCGGATLNPTYRDVCAGSTGHAEVVQITYDPGEIGYRDLLEIFFATHDPTTLNRQGADVGTQYRSAVFFLDEAQRLAAQQTIDDLNAEGIFPRPIVTQVVPLETFYPAEDYHQGYYRQNPGQGYCVAVINPKVAKLRQKFASRLKSG